MVDVNKCRNDNEYVGLVNALIDTKNQVAVMKNRENELNIDEQASIDLQINQASRLIEDVVTDLSVNVKELL